jgi:hypothetical protein
VSDQPTDAGTAAIGLAFGVGASAGGGIGEGAGDMAAFGAGLQRRLRRQAMPFNLPPGLIAAGAGVGVFLDLPPQFGPPTGWFWDITALSAYGFTAGSIAISKNAPIVTPAGNPCAIEPVGSFIQAGVLTYPQRGMPLLDSSERLVFTVTSALTGQAQISGQVIAVPAERIDEYLT